MASHISATPPCFLTPPCFSAKPSTFVAPAQCRLTFGRVGSLRNAPIGHCMIQSLAWSLTRHESVHVNEFVHELRVRQRCDLRNRSHPNACVQSGHELHLCTV
eukprot:Polyplicarium_translucidae@DN3380_c1_g1_i2.p1